MNDENRRENKRNSITCEPEKKFGGSYNIDPREELGEDYGSKLEEMWGGVDMKRELSSWDVRYGVDVGEKKESYNFYEEFRVDLEPKQGKVRIFDIIV